MSAWKCSPYLANDTEATVAEALRLWAAVERPNLMVKVPATAGRHAGDPQADRRGHQHQRHAAVLASRSTSRSPKPTSPGLRTCAQAGGDISRSPASPASSSAASTAPIDKRLDERSPATSRAGATDALRGKVAIANAKLAYQHYQELFSGPRWQRSGRDGREDAAPAVGLHRHQEPGLQRHALCRGADRPRHRQHHAAGDHGRVPRPRQGHARRHRAGYRRAPARCSPSWSSTASRSNEVTDELVDDGVQQFADAVDKLLGAVATSAPRAARRRSPSPADRAGLAGARKAASTRRLEDWRKRRPASAGSGPRDKSLWTGDRRGQMARLARHRRARSWPMSTSCKAFAQDVKRRGFTDVVLLGMGGSSLGPEVLARDLRPAARLAAACTCSTAPIPRRSRRSSAAIDLGKTLFIVSSQVRRHARTQHLQGLFLRPRRQRAAARKRPASISSP